ncbi:MAG: FAD binding domain-containing protein [Thermoplasmata archaeon]|nr:FAD binding domain-containing protein [Thermoplasmata archaeon]
MPFSLSTPKDPAEAFRLLVAGRPGETALLAGGTALLRDLDEGQNHATHLISLRKLPWNRHAWKGEALEIGSTEPLRTLENDPLVRARLPGLHQAIEAVGSVALRHRATLGGNLGRASPASDLIPVLLALEALVNLRSPRGQRVVDIEQFIISSRQTAREPDELIESVSIPRALPSAYVWQRVRPSNDISQVGVAVALGPPPGRWRVALGGVSPRPVRLPEAEEALVSRRPSEAEVELAAQAAARHAPFVTDRRATEGYRRRLVTTLVRRAVRSTAEHRARRAGPKGGR